MQPASRAMMVGANRRALHPSIRDSMSNDPKMICAGVCVGKCPVIHTGQSLSAFQNSHRKTDRCLACTYDHLSVESVDDTLPPTCTSRPNNNNHHHNISHTTRGKLSGGNTSYTYIEHCHVLDHCASITSRVYTCSCWSITYIV